MLGVNPQRVWAVFNHWIEKARKADDPSSITQLGVDETSSRKGHKYVTLGVDLETSRVIHACEGKGKSTLKNIQQHLESKGVAKEQITQLSMDLSPAFIAGAAESFPAAAITFDRFAENCSCVFCTSAIPGGRMLSNYSTRRWTRCAELNARNMRH